MKLLEIISVDFDVIGQLLIMYSVLLVTYRRKVGNIMGQYISFVDSEKACNLLGREVLYSILTEFGIPMK
jgi:hypothetical protein